MRHTLTALALAAFLALGLFIGTPMAQTTVAPNYSTGPLWDDLVSVAGAINPLGADGQMAVVTDAADYIGCLKATTAGETAVVQFQLPHGYMLDSDVHPHIHWVVNGADVTGSTVFDAKFRHCPVVGTCSSWSAFAAGTIDVEPADLVNSTGLTEWVLSDAVYNFDLSSIILMQFKLASTTVTNSITCSADVHFRRSSNGSRQELIR